MKRLFTVWFYLISTGSVFAQHHSFPENDTTVAENYLYYYRSVAVAEEAAVNGNYQYAIQQYKMAFGKYHYNNPVDCYVAAQIASYIGDTVNSLDFICHGLSFGLPVETIISNPHLTACFKKADQGTIDSYIQNYKNRIDVGARATMLSLIKTDQSFIRNLRPGEHLYEDDGYTLKKAYRPLWDSLIKEIVTLTHTRGFPAQKIIGTQAKEDSIFRTGPNSSFALYIFIHHGNAWNQISDVIWKELLKGNITPKMYGAIYEHSNGNGTYNNPILYFASRTCQERKCKSMVKEKLNEINISRRAIGLEDYEVMQKKIEVTAQYHKWRSRKTIKTEPFFDFQCELGLAKKGISY